MPSGVYARTRVAPETRFWAKVNKQAECWLWQACVDKDGYGIFGVSGKNVRAHRFAYELSGRKIPDGLVLDHVCRNRSCVNPSHLESKTSAQNSTAPGSRLGEVNGLKRKCPQGHEYTGENLYIDPKNARRCRECARNRQFR